MQSTYHCGQNDFEFDSKTICKNKKYVSMYSKNKFCKSKRGITDGPVFSDDGLWTKRYKNVRYEVFIEMMSRFPGANSAHQLEFLMSWRCPTCLLRWDFCKNSASPPEVLPDDRSKGLFGNITKRKKPWWPECFIACHTAPCACVSCKKKKNYQQKEKPALGKREAEFRRCPKIDWNLSYWSGKSEFKESFEIARRNLESYMESALPCMSQENKLKDVDGISTRATMRCTWQEALQCDDKIHKTFFFMSIRSKLMNHKVCRIQQSGKRGHGHHIADRGFYFFDSLHSCAKTHTDPSSFENTGCKSRRWQRVGQIRELASMARVRSKK